MGKSPEISIAISVLLCLLWLLIGRIAASEKMASEGAIYRNGHPMWILGHRGRIMYAPENTLVNMRDCFSLGISVELDVMTTKDGKVVVMHDETVDRTTDGKGRVSDMTFEEIRRLDAGVKFDPYFAGEKVPLLEEAFQLLLQFPDENICITLDYSPERKNAKEEIARLLRKYDIFDRVIVFNQTRQMSKDIKDLEGRVRIALILGSHAETIVNDPLADCLWARLRTTGPDRPTSEDVKKAHSKGKKVIVSVVNDMEIANRLFMLGVDGIVTDHPLKMLQAWREYRKNPTCVGKGEENTNKGVK